MIVRSLGQSDGVCNDCRCYKLHENPFIFMRWKEMFFMGNKQVNSNLTIAGFYYICLCRSTGKIEG